MHVVTDSLTDAVGAFFLLRSFDRGLIGPSRQFGVHSIYYPQLYAIIIGCFLPLPFWLWQRRYPNSWAKYISTPILLNGVSYIPPAVGINYSSWFAVGFVFQWLIRKKNFAWWSKFNYITSAAMDGGTVVSLLIIFFALQVRRVAASLPISPFSRTSLCMFPILGRFVADLGICLISFSFPVACSSPRAGST